MNTPQNSASEPYKVTVEANGKSLVMEVDTGAVVSVVSEATWLAVFPSVPLTNCALSLHTFTFQPVEVLGQIMVQVRYKGYAGTHRLVVVKGNTPTLLGRDWLEKMQLDWASLKVVGTKQSTEEVLQ